jgi:hypothetical protein
VYPTDVRPHPQVRQIRVIHRGTFRSVGELTRKIRDLIDGWNGRAHPFVWTKTTDQILTKANRQTTSDADH